MSEKSHKYRSDNVRSLFDKWAEEDKDVGMQEGHQYAVSQALKKVKLPQPLRFLDIGCGNGWLVRKIASENNYDFGIGIDTSPEMIRKAQHLMIHDNIQFLSTDILQWNPPDRFNFLVSMEAFYYVVPMERIMNRLPFLLEPQAVVLVGVDYYEENPGSADWQNHLSIKLDRRSKVKWRQLLENAGIKVEWQEQIKYPEEKSIPDWKIQHGSLFTCGTFSP